MLADDPEELKRTWDRAELRVPGRLIGPDVQPILGYMQADYVQARLSALPQGLQVPLVVFLHGCAGVGLVEHRVARLLDDAGYATLVVNSFARNVRQANCNYQTYAAGMFPPAYLYRRAELIYAVSRVRSLPWVDPNRLILGGYSEGAVATALWGGSVEVSAYIVAGWTCTAPTEYRWIAGLRTPVSRPVFAVVSRADRWHNWPGWRGDCGTMAGDRDNIVSIVIDGAIHNVFAYPETQLALLDFLREYGLSEFAH